MAGLKDRLQTSTLYNSTLDTTGLYTNGMQDLVDSSKFINKEYEYNTNISSGVRKGNNLRPGQYGAASGGTSDSSGGFVDAIMGVGNFTGNLVGGFIDSALFGIPGMIDDMMIASGHSDTSWLREITSFGAYDKWEDEGGAGKFGRSLGFGVGMINPFKIAGKGLTMLSRGATTNFGWTAKTMQTQARRGFQSKYLKQEGVDNLVSAINRIGGGTSKTGLGAGTDTFKKGYNTLFDDAWNLIHTPSYRSIINGSQKMLKEGVEELGDHILGLAPRISKAESRSLASKLIDEAAHHSANSFNRMSEALFTKMPIINKNTTAVETMGAFMSDFVQGATMFGAQSALSNIAVNSTAAYMNESREDVLSRMDKRGAAAIHGTMTLTESLGTLATSSVFMGLMGPTRFVKGGSTYGGQGLAGALKEGLGVIGKAWKPIKRMSGDQARVNLQMIDLASDGMLHSKFDGLVGVAIHELTDDAALGLLKQVRKEFTFGKNGWFKFMKDEFLSDINVLSDITGLRAGKGLQSSVPRMIAGTVAMNSEGIYRMFFTPEGPYKPEHWWQHFGEDGNEIASNIIMGMAFSKSGRSFSHKGKDARTGLRTEIPENNYLQYGDMRKYYASNLNDIHAMRHGLEILGVDVTDLGLDLPSAVYESHRGFMKGQPLFRQIFDLTDNFYVDRTVNVQDPDTRKPAKESYLEFLKDKDILPGSKEHDMAMEEYKIFEQVIETYDNTVPEINKMFRTTGKQEIFQLVKDINGISDIANSQNVGLTLTNARLAGAVKANELYKSLRMEFVQNTLESMGLGRPVMDPSGRLVIPDIEYNKFGLSNTRSQVVDGPKLRGARHNLIEVIKQGAEDGWLIKAGQSTTVESTDNYTKFIQSFEKSKEAMLSHIYGREAVLKGAYAEGGLPKGAIAASESVLYDIGMNSSSVSINNAEQSRNLISLLSGKNYSQSEIYHTLPEGTRERIVGMMKKLGFQYDNIVLSASDNGKQVDINSSEFKDAEAFFSKLNSLYKTLNPKSTPGDAEISIGDIAGLRREIMSVTGDALTNPKIFKRITDESTDYFIDQLKLNETAAPFSTAAALKYLINGDLTSPDTKHGFIQKFAIRTNDGIFLPDADVLLPKLRTLAPDKIDLMTEKEIDIFYKSVQDIASESGNLVHFTKNTGDIDAVINQMGASKIIEHLNNAKIASDKASMNDLIMKTSHLETSQSDISKTSDSLIQGSKISTDDSVFASLSDLHTKTGKLVRLIQIAMNNRDYQMLASLTKDKIEYDKFFNELQMFNDIAPLDTQGDITNEWKLKLTEAIASADNFLNKEYGEINLENYSKFVEDQMKLYQKNLPNDMKTDEMDVSITPTQFEKRYNLSVSQVKSIIDPSKKMYANTGDLQHYKVAYDLLLETATKNNEISRLQGKAKDNDVLSTDVLQTVLTAMTTRQVNKLKWMGDHFVISKSYLTNQDNNGVLGTMKLLGVSDQKVDNFYILDKELITYNSDGDFVRTRTPDPGDWSVFDSLIEVGGKGQNGIFIDNPEGKMALLKGNTGEIIDQTTKGESYVHVSLDEGIRVVIPRTHLRKSVESAFTEGGIAALELSKIFEGTKLESKMKTILKKFRDPNNLNNVEILKEAVLVTRMMVDAPHMLLDASLSLNVADLADTWKRLKMPEFSKGKLFTPDVLKFLQDYYTVEGGKQPWLRDVVKAYNSFKNPDQTYRDMKFISVDDESVSSVFSSKLRLEAYMAEREAQGNHNWTPEQKQQILSQHGDGKSLVDAGTYLTKDSFLLHLSQLGMRKDWLILNDNNEVIGFKSGAIKPKGVHTSVGDDGTIKVFYNKTAFFYDPLISDLLVSKQLDGLAFKSGNKINKERIAKGELVDRYTESEKSGDFGVRRMQSDGSEIYDNTVYADINKVVDSSVDTDVIYLPLDTYNVTNISKEHTAKAGANMSVHHGNDRAMLEWMNLSTRVDQFRDMMNSAMNSEYALTSIAKDLMGYKASKGDLGLDKLPMERIMGEGGLIIDGWMGDVVADKLFSFFFEGNKVATGAVGNSSITPMAPPIHMDMNKIDLGLRYYDVVDGVKIGRQISIGDFTPDHFHMQQEFSFNGRENTVYGGNVKNPNEGAFFVRRIKIKLPGEDIEVDAVISPMQSKKDGKQTWSIVAAGYELNGNKLIDLNRDSGKEIKLDSNESDHNQLVYKTITDEANKIYLDLQSKQDNDRGLKNQDVVDYLALNHEGYYLGALNNRQPRNLINDVVINKIRSSHLEVEGNKSEQNFVDAIETQDSDYDYDKSSSYVSAPGSFVKEVARKAGYGLRDDSYSFAEKFFAKLDVDLTSGSAMRRHLAIVENSASLRGRIVKLHNIVSYVKEGLSKDGVLGVYAEGNDRYEIRMKAESDYFNTVDNISNWAKIFIDNYKNPTDLGRIDDIINDIMFGSREKGTDGNRHYEGLFELKPVGNTKEKHKYIDGRFDDLRAVISKTIISPISKYLRFNRGMTEGQMGESNSLKLKDLAVGFNELRAAFDNTYLYDNNNKLSIGNRADFSLNIRKGVQSLSNYIIGGWGDTPSIAASQNPFDVAMRSLNSFYMETMTGKNNQRKYSEIEKILLQAESGILMQQSGIGDAKFDRTSISDALYNYVRQDFDFIGLQQLHYKVEGLKKQLSSLKRSKYTDKQEIKELADKVEEYEQIRHDIELRIGGQYEYDNKTKTTFKPGYKKPGELRASSDIVFWDSKGNQRLVLRAGEKNPVAINSDWVAIDNPRMFKFSNPDQQKSLDVKFRVFSSMPFETNSSSMEFLDSKVYHDKVDPVMYSLDQGLNIIRDQFTRQKITPAEFSVQRKAYINRALNDPRLDSPMLRKAFIWTLMRPKLDNSKVSYFNVEGKNVNSLYMFENPNSKPMWALLMDISNKEAFVADNVLTSDEANSYIKEIIARQTLGFLGATNHHLDVVIDTDYGSFNSKRNKDLKIELSKKTIGDLEANSMIGENSERALVIINDFLSGDRLLTPFEMGKLSQHVSKSGENIFNPTGTAMNKVPKRKVRSFGNTAEVTPEVYMRDLNGRKRKQRDCGK